MVSLPTNEFGGALLLALGPIVQPLFARRRPSTESTKPPLSTASLRLLAVWSLVMLAATFGQVRFAYYLGVNVALFAGLGCDLVLKLFEGVRQPGLSQELGKADGIASAARNDHQRLQWRLIAVSIALVLAVASPAALRYSRERAKTNVSPRIGYDALQWLRVNQS